MKRLLFVLLCGCSGGLSPGECNDVVDRMIDIFTKPGGDASKDHLKATEDWRAKLKGDNATKQYMRDVCRTSMKSGHAACVKEAQDDASLAKCFAG
ncbi:MAG TPA: hypothetical protein VKE22_02380 [Haliangiales bacterium]|nr:hypothetical protein [Haliangiales bacterium]